MYDLENSITEMFDRVNAEIESGMTYCILESSQNFLLLNIIATKQQIDYICDVTSRIHFIELKMFCTLLQAFTKPREGSRKHVEGVMGHYEVLLRFVAREG